MKALKDIPAESYKKCMQNWKAIFKSIIKIGIHICKKIFFFGSPGHFWSDVVYEAYVKDYNFRLIRYVVFWTSFDWL